MGLSWERMYRSCSMALAMWEKVTKSLSVEICMSLGPENFNRVEKSSHSYAAADTQCSLKIGATTGL